MLAVKSERWVLRLLILSMCRLVAAHHNHPVQICMRVLSVLHHANPGIPQIMHVIRLMFSARQSTVED